MTIEEKHELLDMLWESIEQENYVDNEAEETEEEKYLLRERLENYNNNSSKGISWEILKNELLNRSND